MCLEIEAKVQVQDFSGVAGRLAAVGAEHYDDVTHLDTFYSDASGTMLKAGLRRVCADRPAAWPKRPY